MAAERKLATVLFADIVGSTDVTDSHDPEVVRRTLAQVFAAMKKVLVEHGGTVEKFIGDAVMAVFGVPAGHDDDAERAVRAALRLGEAVRATDQGEGLSLRIGINTGEVVTGDEEHAETLVTGTPVILAGRLQTAAAPGEILVGALTRRLTEDGFEWGPIRSVAAKGFGEIPASPVRSAIRALPGRVVNARGTFVGRAGEITRLRAAYDDVRRSGTAARLVLLGPAGIGKTRLAEQFDREVTGGRATWGHCIAYGQSTMLWPLQEIIRARAGVGSHDTPQEALKKFENVAVGALADPDAPAVISRLRALLSGEAWSTEISPQEAQRELASALARGLEMTHDGPVTTIVIEDVHVAEPALLEIIDAVCASARVPLLVLALARPDLIERFPDWAAKAERMRLGPLPPSDAEQLARSLLRARSAPDSLATILSRAEGNPLYIEELAQTLLERGDALTVPPTLRGLIAARVDHAGGDVRRLLQCGSALGRDFWLDALPWPADAPEIAGCAAEAERRGLVVFVDTPGPSGEPAFRFRHALIRDVVYTSTSKVERARLHVHYAAWLGSVAAERGVDLTETIAYHAEQAFELAEQVEDRRAAELGLRAFEALLRATTAARGRADFRSALALSERTLAVAKRSGVARTRVVDALGENAMIRLRLEPSAEALRLLDEAIGAAREVGFGEQLVHLLMWRAGIALADDLALARSLVGEAVEVARATGDNELIAYSLSRSGKIGEATGSLDEQARALTEARDLALRTGALSWLPDTLAELSANALHQGEVAAARRYAEDACRSASVHGSPLQRFKGSLGLAWSALGAGDLDSALAEARAALALGREVGGPWALALGTEAIGEILLARDEIPAARQALDEAAAKLDPTATPAMRSHVARIRALRSAALLASGAVALARDSALAAHAIAPKTDVRARAVAMTALGEVEAASGHTGAARALFEEALATLEGTGYRALAEKMRDRYERVAVVPSA